MDMKTSIKGYATTLYHAEHVPHAEAVRRFHAVLRMNPESNYELETLGFDGRIRLFINEEKNRRTEIMLNSDHIVIREVGENLKRESFDRRVYETAVAFLDNFDIRQFSYQSVAIQSSIEPLLDRRDPFFSWQGLFGAIDRLPALLQRDCSQGSFRMEFDATRKNPEKISLLFRWNQRTPSTSTVE